MTAPRFVFVWLMAGWLALAGPATPTLTPISTAPGKNPKAEKVSFEKDVQPLLSRYCYGCHGEKKKGDLDLRIYTDEKSTAGNQQVFEKVLKNLQAHEMPPENKPQPTPAERALITSWVGSFFFPCDCEHPDPGRVTIRRLNRVEYNNTVRDLLGVDFHPADDFPADDSGYGFDNIGDVLSLSPVLLDKYLAAAGKVVDAAFTGLDKSTAGKMAQAEAMETQSQVMACQPTSATKLRCAQEITSGFARRAFRRPVAGEEVDRLLALFKSADAAGEGFQDSIKLVLQAVLVSPDFLFRAEITADSKDGQLPRPVDDYALASRLSYFIWSSMPDSELFAQAQHRTLRRNLEAEVRRMLKDPKAEALTKNLSGQWLQLGNLKLASPDSSRFPDFNEELRASMQKETEMFFDFILRENRSVLEFIDADYSFLDEKLARLYGIGGVEGDNFRRVSLTGTRRGGLLTQASILTITSNPTRTSPVKRGKWVLENILGAPPPPPPPDVPELQEGKAALVGTLRHRMEQHRANPTCASCHSHMDPIGFGFENYDGIGRWREKEGEFAIDASGDLSGKSFNGPADLKAILANQKRDDFVRCMTEKILTYALGRGLEYYDKCAVDQLTKNVTAKGYKFSALILEVTKSVPFQMSRVTMEKAPNPKPQNKNNTKAARMVDFPEKLQASSTN